MIASALLLGAVLGGAPPVPPPGDVLRGRVVDQEGRPAPPGVLVRAEPEGGRGTEVSDSRITFTEAGGVFVFEGLGDLPRLLTAGAEGTDAAPAEAAVAARAGAGEVRLSIIRGYTFSGFLHIPRTRAGPGQVVFLALPGSEEALAEVPLGMNTRFDFRGIRASRVELFVAMEGVEVACGIFDLPVVNAAIRVPEAAPGAAGRDAPRHRNARGDPPGSRRVGGTVLRAGFLDAFVTDETGKPVEGAEVVIRRLDDAKRNPEPVNASNGRTNPGGFFGSPALGADWFEMRVEAPGHPPWTRVMSPQAEVIGVVLGRSHVVDGVVVDEASGAPVAGISLLLQDSSGREARGVTDAGGRFELRTAPAGTGTLTIGSDPDRLWRGPVNPGEYASRRIPEVVIPSEGMRIELRRGRALGGRFLDAEGKSLPGNVPSLLQASLSRVDGAGRIHQTSLGGLTIGADGSFRIPGLPAGRYAIEVTFKDQGSGEFLEFRPFLVEAGAEDLALRVPLAPGISGRVLDREGRPFAEGTEVSVLLAEEGAINTVSRALTAADGSFATGRLDGTRLYQVFVRAAGMVPGSATDVRAGTADLLLVPSPGQAIEGRVTDDGGKALPEGIRLQASEVPYDLRSLVFKRVEGTTGAGGVFRLEGLEPGKTYRLAAMPGQGYLPDILGGVSAAAGARGLVVSLRRAWFIAGRILGPEGKPIPWATVEAEPVNRDGFPGEWRWTAFTDSEGRFRVENLPAGSLVLRGSDRNGGTWYLGTHDVPAEHLELRVE